MFCTIFPSQRNSGFVWRKSTKHYRYVVFENITTVVAVFLIKHNVHNVQDRFILLTSNVISCKISWNAGCICQIYCNRWTCSSAHILTNRDFMGEMSNLSFAQLSAAVDIFLSWEQQAEIELRTSILSQGEVKPLLLCLTNLSSYFSEATRIEEIYLHQISLSRIRHRLCSGAAVVHMSLVRRWRWQQMGFYPNEIWRYRSV